MKGAKSFADFFRRRILRLYPLYLIVLAAYIAGSLAIPKMSKLPPDSHAAVILILQSLVFLPGLLPIQPIMDVAWTLSFVVYFYFIGAGAAALFKRIGLSRVPRAAILVAAAALWAVAGESFAWWERRTAIFWVGMALWEVIEGMSHHRRSWAIRLSVPAAALVVLGVLVRTALMLNRPDTGAIPITLWRTLITSVTLAASVWVAYFGPDWWKRLLASPQLSHLGMASYSFYLTHGSAVKIFRFWIIPWLGPAGGSPLVFWTGQVSGLCLSVFIARVVYT